MKKLTKEIIREEILDTLNKNRYKYFLSLNNKLISITNKGRNFINIIKQLEMMLISTKEEYKNYLIPIENYKQEVKSEQTTI